MKGPKLRLQYAGCGDLGNSSATVSFKLQRDIHPNMGIKLMAWICSVSNSSSLCANTDVIQAPELDIGSSSPLKDGSMSGTWLQITPKTPAEAGQCTFGTTDWFMMKSGVEETDPGVLFVDQVDYDQLIHATKGLNKLNNPKNIKASTQKTHASVVVQDVCFKSCDGKLLGQCAGHAGPTGCSYGPEFLCIVAAGPNMACLKEQSIYFPFACLCLFVFILAACLGFCCCKPAAQVTPENKIKFMKLQSRDRVLQGSPILR